MEVLYMKVQTVRWYVDSHHTPYYVEGGVWYRFKYFEKPVLVCGTLSDTHPIEALGDMLVLMYTRDVRGTSAGDAVPRVWLRDDPMLDKRWKIVQQEGQVIPVKDVTIGTTVMGKAYNLFTLFYGHLTVDPRNGLFIDKDWVQSGKVQLREFFMMHRTARDKYTALRSWLTHEKYTTLCDQLRLAYVVSESWHDAIVWIIIPLLSYETVPVYEIVCGIHCAMEGCMEHLAVVALLDSVESEVRQDHASILSNAYQQYVQTAC